MKSQMDCNTSQSMLSALLDGELSPLERDSLHEHLSGCAACRRELDELKRVDAAFQDMTPVLAPESFERDVQAAIQRSRAAQTRHTVTRRVWPYLSAAAAAVILIAGGVTLMMRPAQRFDMAAAPEAAKQLQEQPTATRTSELGAHSEAVAGSAPTDSNERSVEVPPEVEEELRALGYMASEDVAPEGTSAPAPEEMQEPVSNVAPESVPMRDEAPVVVTPPPPAKEMQQKAKAPPEPTRPAVRERAKPIAAIRTETNHPVPAPAPAPAPALEMKSDDGAERGDTAVPAQPAPDAPPAVRHESPSTFSYDMSLPKAPEVRDDAPHEQTTRGYSWRGQQASVPPPPALSAPAPVMAAEPPAAPAPPSPAAEAPIKKAESVRREADKDAHKTDKRLEEKKIAGRAFENRNGIWTQQDYAGQKTKALRWESKQAKALLEKKHPELAGIKALGTTVVVEIDGTWFRFGTIDNTR